ncbi:MAG: carboxypeptidase regulatory-like domain-containing protein [Planctomycetota bacterium]|jgi:protocatechuate 3,4-dioxygenase beta subunit
MRKDRIGVFCLAVIVCFAGGLAAEEAKQITCTGKVIDAAGRPVGGAKVKLYELIVGEHSYSFEVEAVKELTTREDGAFTIEMTTDSGDLTSQWVILVEKEGLAIGWANWFRREDIDVEIKLGEPKELAGVVVDENNKPIAEVEVNIYMLVIKEEQRSHYMTSKVATELFITKTDEQGKFVFSRIPAEATAEFLVKKAGRATVSTFKIEGYRGGKMQFAPGQNDIKIVQPVEAKVEGMVVEKGTSKGVSGVRLMVTEGQNRPNFGQEAVESGADGRFTIGGLTAGRHILQLVAPREELASWVAKTLEVTTEAGETKSGVRIQVSKGGVLEVVVTEAAGKKPVEKAGVSIKDEESNQWLRGRSDKDGIARIRLAPGEYKIGWIYKEGYQRFAQIEEVTIADGGTERVEVELVNQPKIAGVVRDKTGRTVEGAQIRICPSGGIRSTTTTDAEGKFEVSWNPRMWGGPQEETVYYLVVREVERNLAAVVEIKEDTKQLDVKLAEGVIFTGKVVDTEGKAIAGAKITVYLRASRWSSSITDWQKGGAVSDAEGKFEVKAMPGAHKYNVQASAEGYGKNEVEALADDAVDNRLDLGEFALALANLSVSGVVVDANDTGVGGARIYVYGEGQPDRHNIQTDAQDIQTDAEGKFTIEKVCAGKIRLNANVFGQKQMYGFVETAGGATDVKIVVSERGSTRTRSYAPKQPPSLVGKALPDLKEVKIELSPDDSNGQKILVCFWDMEQRPSRHCIRELAKKAEQLKQKGVTVVAVQASKVGEKALNEWVKKYNINFPAGMIEGDEEKTRFKWGVRSLPWLILTDAEHFVRSNGFGLNELDEKINAIVKE